MVHLLLEEDVQRWVIALPRSVWLVQGNLALAG